MTNYAKVKDHKGLLRDMESKAIINVDTEALENHRRKKTMMLNIVNNSSKIEKLEEDISEIKNLLNELLKRNRT